MGPYKLDSLGFSAHDCRMLGAWLRDCLISFWSEIKALVRWVWAGLTAVPRAVWAGLAVVVAAVVVLWESIRRAQRVPEPARGPDQLPEVPLALQSRVQSVEEQALVSKITATATAEAHKAELAQTLQVEDGAERRRRLAALLETLR